MGYIKLSRSFRPCATSAAAGTTPGAPAAAAVPSYENVLFCGCSFLVLPHRYVHGLCAGGFPFGSFPAAALCAGCGELCAHTGILYSGRSHGDAGKLCAVMFYLVIGAFLLPLLRQYMAVECVVFVSIKRNAVAFLVTPDFITKELSWPPPRSTHVERLALSLERCATRVIKPSSRYVSLLVTSIERKTNKQFLNNPAPAPASMPSMSLGTALTSRFFSPESFHSRCVTILGSSALALNLNNINNKTRGENRERHPAVRPARYPREEQTSKEWG